MFITNNHVYRLITELFLINSVYQSINSVYQSINSVYQSINSVYQTLPIRLAIYVHYMSRVSNIAELEPIYSILE